MWTELNAEELKRRLARFRLEAETAFNSAKMTDDLQSRLTFTAIGNSWTQLAGDAEELLIWSLLLAETKKLADAKGEG